MELFYRGYYARLCIYSIHLDSNILQIEEDSEKVRCGASAVVRITLKDGCYHEVCSLSFIFYFKRMLDMDAVKTSVKDSRLKMQRR